MIITFANHKGGVGKTMLALIAAETLIDNGAKVEIYDLDAQGNFNFFMQTWRNDLTQGATQLPDTINDKGKYIVIDTAPGLGEAAEAAIKAADVIVVPVDTDAAAMQGFSHIMQLKPKGKIILVINRYNKKIASAAAIAEQIKEGIKGTNAAIFQLPVSARVSFNRNAGKFWAHGMTDQTASPFMQLIKEIVKEG